MTGQLEEHADGEWRFTFARAAEVPFLTLLPTPFTGVPMSKLKTIKPLIATIKPMLSMPKGERQRTEARPWRAWYKTAKWQKLRWSILVRDHFTCQMVGCGKIETDTSLLVADHRIPHRGDSALFWDDDNLQCLCKSCHDSLKQKEEAATRNQAQGGWA